MGKIMENIKRQKKIKGGEKIGQRKKYKHELVFKVKPGKLQISSSSTKNKITSDIKKLKKFGFKKGKSSTSLKTGQYFHKKY